MKKKTLILTFDCGTQSIRGLIFDQMGNILAKEQEYFEPYFSREPGYAEQKWEVYWNAFTTVSKRIHQKNPELIEMIEAVTTTTIRDTNICIDKDGNLLRDVIVWMDQRKAKCEKPLPKKNSIVFNLVGMGEALEGQRKVTKSNWLQENEPEIWEKTYKYLLFSGYLNYVLTGKIVDSYANQVAHIPFDYKNKTWQKENALTYPVFNVSIDKLPDLVNPGDILGTITKKASEETGIKEGTPLIATGSDKGCETLGSGVLSENVASLSFGTTATIQFATKKYIEPDSFLPAYPGIVKEYYNPEVQIYRGFWMISWFKQEFAQREVVEAKKLGIAPEIILNKMLADVQPGSDGLILQPFWDPMLKNPEARGSIIGFTSDHTRKHIYRAIIEGIGYALYHGMKAVEKRMKTKIEYLTVSGGGSQSDEICQITADLFGLPVKRIQTYEACGLGSSMVGFVTLGIYKDYHEAIKNMVNYVKVFETNPKNHEIYQEIYHEVYNNIYKQLKPLYTKMKTMMKKKEDRNETI